MSRQMACPLPPAACTRNVWTFVWTNGLPPAACSLYEECPDICLDKWPAPCHLQPVRGMSGHLSGQMACPLPTAACTRNVRTFVWTNGLPPAACSLYEECPDICLDKWPPQRYHSSNDSLDPVLLNIAFVLGRPPASYLLPVPAGCVCARELSVLTTAAREVKSLLSLGGGR